MLFTKSYSQNPFTITLSPNGVLESVFDQYGKSYSLSDIMIDNQSSNTNRSVLVTCSSTSYFNLYFEPGCGMETVADPTQNATNSARRAVVCKVFEDISNFINSPLSNPGNTTKVNIWVRNINNVVTSPNGVLGLATSFYNLPNSVTNGGIADGEIWKTIHAGVDSYTNVAAPISVTSTTTTSSGAFYHGMIAFNFNTTFPVAWNTTLTGVAPNGQYDLYSVVLHEVTHALGFASLLDQYGNSKFGNNYKYYSRYDTFLKDNAGTSPIIKTNSTLSGWYDNFFNTALSTNILHPNCTLTNFENTSASLDYTICSDALKYIGSTTAPVYTPTCYESGSSFSHFEDQLYPNCVSSYGNNNYFVMSNSQGAISPYNTKRYLKDEEKAVLCDIGYSVKSSFGSSSVALNATASGPYNYSNGSCGGINVAGINDGLNVTTSSFTFMGNVSSTSNISISGILLNDSNATGFEGLQDLMATAAYPTSLSTTTGDATTIISFSSMLAGLHLLRYIPTNGAQKGNITYIYVYVYISPNTAPANTCVPTSNDVCNLVSNGDFEQYSTLPTFISQPNTKQISKACGWFDATINGTADYYNANALFSAVQIPCNFFGTQTCNTGGNGYIGFFFTSPNGQNNSETVYTKLSSPLVANQTYQLTMDISLAEGNSSFSYAMQAYLSATPLPLHINGNVVSTGVSVMMEAPTVIHSNYSTWDTVTFVFTATGGEQYLYLGGLQDVVATAITPAPSNSSCAYNNYNGFQPEKKTSYYYIDNVKLAPTNGAALNLPPSLCINQNLSDLSTYILAAPSNGVFSGPGVVLANGVYSFNPIVAGVGTSTINYTYVTNLNCTLTISGTITVTNTTLITPTFAQILPVCNGETLAALPTTSLNGIVGTWSPALNNTVTTTYTFTPAYGFCATTATMTITVKPLPYPGVLSSISQNVCVGITVSFYSSITGGVWSSSNAAVASVDAGGIVTGNIAGTATISYTVTVNGCVAAAFRTITVNALPILGGLVSFCQGSTANITPATGGIWTSNNTSIATVTNAGLVTSGVATGPVLLTFTDNTTGCSASRNITVNPKPVLGGDTKVCVGGLPLIVTPATGGTWTSTTPLLATVTTTGSVTGIAAGTAILSFTSTAGCGLNKTIVVNAKPVLAGLTSVCVGNTVIVTPATGGTWSSTNTAYGTITNAGLVTGITPGATTLTFTNTTTTCTATKPMTVYAIPNPVLSGTQTVCVGSTVSFSATIAGGTWSSSNPSIASINTSGVITGIGAGSATITYSVKVNGCTGTTTRTITVNAKTTPIFTFTTSFCWGATVPTLPTTSNNGITGTWSPSTINNTMVGLTNYTFTPAATQCATSVIVPVTITALSGLTANLDNFTYGYLQTAAVTTPSILDNDLLNGAHFTAATPNITFALVGTPPTISNGGIALNPDGTFTIQPYTTPGTYVFTYSLSYPCAYSPIGTATIKINPPVITQPGKYSFGPALCFSQNSQTTYTGLYNAASWGDNIGVLVDGVPASPLNLTIVPYLLPTGITLNPNGTVTIAGGVLPSNITIFYIKLFPKGSTTYGTAFIPVTVQLASTLTTQDDSITFDTAGNTLYGSTRNVLANDGYSSTCLYGIAPPVPNVTVSLMPSPPNGPFSINSFGDVSALSYPSGGPYVLSYTICDLNNPTICMDAVVSIYVVSTSKMSNASNLSHNVNLNSVIISPNPFDSELTISFDTVVKDVTIELYSVVGQKVYENTVTDLTDYLLKTDNLASGTYMLKITNEHETIIKKIVKR